MIIYYLLHLYPNDPVNVNEPNVIIQLFVYNQTLQLNEVDFVHYDHDVVKLHDSRVIEQALKKQRIFFFYIISYI